MTIQLKKNSRSPHAHMGRFGGGWQWKVGVQAGNLSRTRGCIIVSLLTFSVRLDWDAA